MAKRRRPLATSWHNKFLNPANDGVVLPILHLNGYKIANPCLARAHQHDELNNLFKAMATSPTSSKVQIRRRCIN